MLHVGTVWARRVILLLAAIAFCSALTVAYAGGFVVNVLGQRISSHDPVRALFAGVMLAGFYMLMCRQYWRTDVRILTRITPPTWIAALCTAAALIVGIHWGTFMGTGPDASGYVSEADLWAHGALTTPAPEWGRGARWTNARWSSAPVGYLPGPAPSTLVPTYSPGLPLMMALFEVVGGRDAVFYVVPLLGALAVWASYLLGRHFAGPWAGALAALLMVCSPVFLWFLVQPMSDVPATACWAVALAFALRGGVWPAVMSGTATAVAILVRPNLVPLAAIPALLLLTTRDASIRVLLVFGLAAAPGAMAIAVLNQHWYGSPLQSGYGTLDFLYSTDRIWPNLVRYGSWLMATQTPLMLLGLAAPLVLRSERPERYRLALVTVAYPIAVFAMYAAYLMYDGWSYLRFLLPAFPAVLAGVGAVLVRKARESRRPGVAIVLVVAVTASVAFWGWRYAHREGAFRYAINEERFARAVDFVNTLPANAILISDAYSGTLRFYTGRDVLRWGVIFPHEFDGALAYLRGRGHPLYFVGDPFEEKAFKAYPYRTDVAERFDRGRVQDRGYVFVASDLTPP